MTPLNLPWSIARGLLAGVLVCCAPVQAAGAPEYEIKARLLGIIGSYVVWPDGGNAQGHGPGLVIGVLGRSPFQRQLDRLMEEGGGQKRKIQVLYLKEPEPAQIAACDLLFICASEAGRLERILQACKGKPVYTVADTPGFASQGVMLNLLVISGNMNLEVNLRATREAGLEIRSSFLAIAKGKAKMVESPAR